MSNRAVFLDRDGTLIEHYDYLIETDQVQLLPRCIPALKLLRDHGFLLVVVSNQSAVARGMLTEKKLGQIHDHLRALLGRQTRRRVRDGPPVQYARHQDLLPLQKPRHPTSQVLATATTGHSLG